MAIKYLERRRERARETLRVLRDYSNTYNLDSKVRNLVNFEVLGRSGEENPLKSLRRIKRSIGYRVGNTFKEIFRRAEEYESLSELERQNIQTEEVKQFKLSRRVKRLEGGLENWVQIAKLILSDIMKNNPEAMDGFEYYSHFNEGSMGAGPIYNRIVSKDGSICLISISNYDRGDEDSLKREKPYSLTSLAERILKNINPEEESYLIHTGGYTGLEYTIAGHFEFLAGLNHKRNHLVQEIEKRIGRNLKKEVYEARQNSKTASVDIY